MCFPHIGLLIVKVEDDGDEVDRKSLIMASSRRIVESCCRCVSSRSSKSKSVKFESEEVNISFNKFVFFSFFVLVLLFTMEKERNRKKENLEGRKGRKTLSKRML